MMALVWNIMNNLGEIVVYLPLKGATIPYFVERFVEPSLAFAAGWNYWYAYAILVAGTSTILTFQNFHFPFLPLRNGFLQSCSIAGTTLDLLHKQTISRCYLSSGFFCAAW